jgi:hypothetical protein
MSNIESFNTIKNLSKSTFDFNTSTQELEKLIAFEENVRDINIKLQDTDYIARINELSQIAYFQELGGVQLEMNAKALSDVLSKSYADINMAHFNKYNKLTDESNPEVTVGTIMLNDARSNPKNKDGNYTDIVWNEMIRSIVSETYPTTEKTGLKTGRFIKTFLDLLPQLEPLRALPEGVRTEAKPMFECKFNEESGATYGKIVYDFTDIDGIDLKDSFGFGTEFKDNYYGSGKMVIGAFTLIVDCFNGYSHRESLSSIVANHTSVQNMLKPMYELMLPDYSRGGSPDLLDVLSVNVESIETVTPSLTTAIMTRVKSVIDDPKTAFKKVKTVIDPEYQEIFDSMLVSSIIFNTDFKREMETDVIKNAAQMSVKDVEKELAKLVEKKKINISDVSIITSILEKDDTIPEELKNTAYGLGNAVTRFANSFQSSNDKKYNDYQELGRNIFEVLPTVNYNRRSNKTPVW